MERINLSEKFRKVHMLIEPKSTLNTGNVIDNRTIANLEWT